MVTVVAMIAFPLRVLQSIFNTSSSFYRPSAVWVLAMSPLLGEASSPTRRLDHVAEDADPRQSESLAIYLEALPSSSLPAQDLEQPIRMLKIALPYWLGFIIKDYRLKMRETSDERQTRLNVSEANVLCDGNSDYAGTMPVLSSC